MLSKYFRGKNFMTPEVIEYGEAANGLVYEFSTGKGLFGREIFGVTVVEKTHFYTPVSELSQSFESRTAAEEYIKKLKQGEV